MRRIGFGGRREQLCFNRLRLAGRATPRRFQIVAQLCVGYLGRVTLLMVQQSAFGAFNEAILCTQINATAYEARQVGKVVEMMDDVIVAGIIVDGCDCVAAAIGQRDDDRYLLLVAIVTARIARLMRLTSHRGRCRFHHHTAAGCQTLFGQMLFAQRVHQHFTRPVTMLD